MKQWDLRGVTYAAGRTARGRTETDTTRVVESGLSISVRPTFDSVRVLVDQLPAVIWTTNENLTFTSAVGAALSNVGLGPNQIVGASLHDFFHENASATIDAHRRALGGVTATYRMLWGDRVFHAQVAPLRDADGETIGTICVGVDVDQPDDEEWRFLTPG
ncbi:MAG TPA: PAS domain-containing protein [Actinomycetota bacterium]|nr:PAS domain-containing protein [Actinomycetota bacterium]